MSCWREGGEIRLEISSRNIKGVKTAPSPSQLSLFLKIIHGEDKFSWPPSRIRNRVSSIFFRKIIFILSLMEKRYISIVLSENYLSFEFHQDRIRCNAMTCVDSNISICNCLFLYIFYEREK